MKEKVESIKEQMAEKSAYKVYYRHEPWVVDDIDGAELSLFAYERGEKKTTTANVNQVLV